jgi:flavin reductase (DIM6/NTAB) family NADH-FMN oxidoreductase RutF
MFYEVGGHKAAGLPHDPLKAIVAPRPIGWISTLDAERRPNLAPYSFFNMIQTHPPMVAFCSDTLKHSASNAIATGEFVVNLVTRPLFDAMNTSADAFAEGENEFEKAGLAMAPSRLVKPPRVAASPANLECKVLQHIELHDLQGRAIGGWMVLAQVVGVHIDEAMLTDGMFDTVKARAVARGGYRDYFEVTEAFTALRPTDGGAWIPGQRDL